VPGAASLRRHCRARVGARHKGIVMTSSNGRTSVPAAPLNAPLRTRDVELAEAEPAAQELVAMLCHVYTDRNNRIHAPTIVGGAAALTGEFALRATGLPLPRIGFVFGDPINEILFEGGRDQATLWDVLEKSAATIGVPKDDLPDAREVFGRVAAAAATITRDGGDAVFPPLSIPDAHYPKEWSPNAGPRLRAAVQEIAMRYRLTARQTALALGVATGELIQQGKDLLPAKIAFQLAVEVMFSTAKMAPLAERV
jgi:hypothetical protein